MDNALPISCRSFHAMYIFSALKSSYIYRGHSFLGGPGVQSMRIYNSDVTEQD